MCTSCFVSLCFQFSWVELLGQVVTLLLFEEPPYCFPQRQPSCILVGLCDWHLVSTMASGWKDLRHIWAGVLPPSLSLLSGLQSCTGGRNHKMEESGSLDEGCLTRNTHTPWCKQEINIYCVKPLRFLGLPVPAAGIILTNSWISIPHWLLRCLWNFKCHRAHSICHLELSPCVAGSLSSDCLSHLCRENMVPEFHAWVRTWHPHMLFCDCRQII